MPSTGWNVFVASGVAVVVYLGLRMGRVLPALVAGTLLFIGGWMTGYAINEGAPISIPRMLVAGGICGFVIVWTLLIEQGDYVVGAVVIGLVSFAAWFTSDIGPVAGNDGPMAAIDEPKPPEGPRPGTPVELGGGEVDDPPSSTESRERESVLGRIASTVTPSEPEPPEPESPGASGPDPAETTDHGGEDATYTTRRVDRDEATECESVFGLGIFYEGDPEGPSAAGAATEPEDGDHTRPGAEEPRPEGGADAGDDEDEDETDEPVEPIEMDVEESSDDDGDSERPPAAEPGEAKPTGRLREPADSPLRPGKTPAKETGTGGDHGDTAAVDVGSEAADAGDSEASVASGGDGEPEEVDTEAEADDTDDEPPEDHRVDIEDEGGFMFG